MYKHFLFSLVLLVNFVVSYKITPLSSDIWSHPYAPHWNEKSQSLYFVDFLSSKNVINRYDLRENRFYSATIRGNQTPAFFIPLKNRPNQFAGGIERTVKLINWNGRDRIATTTHDIFSVEQSHKYDGNYWNVAKASPSNKFYGATYRTSICSISSAASASLYRYSKKSGVERLLKNIKISSNLEWNVKRNKAYFIDSCSGIIHEFQYDPATMELCNERIVYRFCDIHAGKIPSYIPLGLTIDTKGFLWVTLYRGGAVLKIDPKTSKVVEEIKIPAEIVTSTAFGGPELDTLFVLTGSKFFNLKTGVTESASLGGRIFVIKDLGAKGLPGRKLLI